jgi:hypothetical protein
MADETYYKTYTFKPHKSGDSVLEKVFTFSSHIMSNIVSVEMLTQYPDCKLTSDAGGGITITDAANWIFKIDKQIINWLPRLYKYDITITMADGNKRTYITGTWQIVE